MGIEGLTQEVVNEDKKKLRTGLNFDIPLDELAGKRMWVDVQAIFYAHWSSELRRECEKEDLLEKGVDFVRVVANWKSVVSYVLSLWTKAGIELTLVLDGAAPIEKTETQSSRRGAREAYLTKATRAVQDACNLCQVEYVENSLHVDGLEVPLQHVKALDDIRKSHRDALKNGIAPIKSNWNELAEHLIDMGFNVVRCNVEAETLCCKAVKDGRADYVLSSDSDCLAYRIPVWLRNYEMEKQCFRAVRLADVLERLGLDEARFLDYCILSGCDYNTRIRFRTDGSALRMGPVNILKRLKTASLSEMMQTERNIDWSILRYDDCVRIFNLAIDAQPISIRISSDVISV